MPALDEQTLLRSKLPCENNDSKRASIFTFLREAKYGFFKFSNQFSFLENVVLAKQNLVSGLEAQSSSL